MKEEIPFERMTCKQTNAQMKCGMRSAFAKSIETSLNANESKSIQLMCKYSGDHINSERRTASENCWLLLLV